MSIWLLVFPIFVLSWLLTRLAIRYALSRQMMDLPNTRSSHTLPTPRGGGIGFVLAFLFSLCCLSIVGKLEVAGLIAFAGSSAAVACIGFIDDHIPLSARFRLFGQFLAAGFALYWLGGLPPLEWSGHVVELGWVSWLVGLLYLVWMLNLYNFMDGIDGLASIETISVCLGMCLIFSLVEAGYLIAMPVLLAASVAGFLLWNFPPAKVFMGDVGSGFLGFHLGLLAIYTAWSRPELLYSWLILSGVFIVDATFTLLRRMLQGDKVYEAHRSHAYQRAAKKYGHRTVTLSVLAINVLFLLPVSLLVALGKCDPVVGLLVSFSLLTWLAYYLEAGKSG